MGKTQALPTHDVRTGRRTARLPALLILAGTAAVAAPASAEPDPAPSRAAQIAHGASTASTPKDDRTSCTSCHAEIAREWEGSGHRRSGTDPAYLTAVAKEPLAFCRACHVPSGDPSKPTPASIAERGIGCPDCHAGLRSDHATLSRKPSRARTCASCHEFRFPSSSGLMQRTVTEHRASAFASTTCESCHMPRTPASATGRPHEDHRFRVDDAMLARALVVDATRAGPSRVALRIRPGDVGHAMPTGDLFRRLEVRIVAKDGDDEIADKSRWLSRKFRSERVTDGVYAKVDAKDDRVGAGLEPCFELDVGARGAGRPLSVTITYERVQEPRTANDDVVLNGSSLLFSTTLPANQGALHPCR